MTAGGVVGVYRPAARDARGRPVCDWDEDSTTLAVEAVRLAISSPAEVRSVTIVSRTATYSLDDAATVIAAALRLPDEAPVTQVQGAGPAALLAVSEARVGDVIVALDTEGAVGAAAVMLRSESIRPTVVARYRHSLPMRVRAAGEAETTVYDDARLMRERGWRPAVEALSDGAETVVTGIPASVSSRLLARAPRELEREAESSWAALAALGECWTTAGGRVAALDGASGVAVEATAADVSVRRTARPEYPASERLPGGRIAISLPAYERAFDAKVRLSASRCQCGAIHFPPRRSCPVCGQWDTVTDVPLAHDASVYSVVTVRTPLPGLPSAYSLAVVDIADAGVRALVHVTSATAGSVAIGAAGQLVLRKVAEREGVPDYGYGFVAESAS